MRKNRFGLVNYDYPAAELQALRASSDFQRQRSMEEAREEWGI